MKKKHSCGVICLRRTARGYEALLVKRRYSYYYVLFVYGQYTAQNHDEIRRYLDHMTLEEKLLIKSLNFASIWYHLNLSVVKSREYKTAKSRFKSSFLYDDGKKLIDMINRSNSIEMIWCLPKGQKNRQESDLMAAVREFHEETGISKKKYRMFIDGKTTTSHIEEGVKYITTYYFALFNQDVTPGVKVNIGNDGQIGEISAMKWYTLRELRPLNIDAGVYSSIRAAIGYVRKR